MLKGVNQWCFPVGTPLEVIFDLSRKAGFDTVELNTSEPGGVGLTTETTTAQAREIADKAKQSGLQISSISTNLFGKNPLSSPEASVRQKGRELLLKQLELASTLEVDTILVVVGRVTEEVSYDDCYKRSQEELFKVIPEIEASKVQVGIENVWNKFLTSPLDMARYIDELQSPNIGAYFDVGNVMLFGFPQHWIHILGKRIRKVHVKDFKTAVGNGGGFVPLLAGDVNWIAVREALREIGYTGPLTAELSSYRSSFEQTIYDTARHIDLIIGNEAK